MTDGVGTSATNLADWHESQLRALDLPCRRSPALWCCEATAPPIYHGAITLSGADHASEQRHRLEELVADRGPAEPLSVRDCWSALDLTDLGFASALEGGWWVRPPGELASETPAGLRIEEVGTVRALREFEEASIAGFEMHAAGKPEPFGLHAPGILDDLRLRLFAGRVAGRIVSVAMAYLAAKAVGIYGVATLPEHRGRGYARTLTREALRAAPDLPALLQPTEVAADFYGSMGFEEVGRYRVWEWRGWDES